MEFMQPEFGHKTCVCDGQILVEWTLPEPEGNYIESSLSETVAIVKDRPFGEESEGFYVWKDLPEYGLAMAVKIPVEEEDLLIDLGW